MRIQIIIAKSRLLNNSKIKNELNSVAIIKKAALFEKEQKTKKNNNNSWKE